MSNAASQASDFYKTVVMNGVVFTFQDDDGYLVFPVDSREVVPFWSSAARCQTVQAEHSKYAKFSITEESLADFMDTTLTLFESERIYVGVNWSGKRLIGYDVSAGDMRENLTCWLNKN